MSFFVYQTKKYLHIFFIFLLSVAIPIVIQFGILTTTDSLDAFLQSTVSNALAAKGGIGAILFNWIARLIPLILESKSQIICIVLSFIIALLLRHYNKTIEQDEKESSILGIVFAVLVMIGIAVTIISLYVSYYLSKLIILDNFPVIIYCAVVLIFLSCLVLLIKKIRQKQDPTWLASFIVLQGVVLSLGFGSGTSAGLSAGETCLAIGIIFAILFKLFGDAYKSRIKLFLIAICGLMIGCSISGKNLVPYSWWGLTEANIDAITEDIDHVPYLEGLRVSQSSKEMYEETYALYQKYLKEDDALFTFPHNPIFYLIADKTPVTYSYVQWFDVSSDDTLEMDMQTLQEVKPKVLSVMFINEAVIQGHEKLFRDGKPSKQREMQEFLKSFLKENGYVQMQEFLIDNVNYLRNYVKCDKAQDVLLKQVYPAKINVTE